MRRTEALQGVRMAVFLNLLSRWESAELNQEEAAELLGVSERTFRRWTRRYEEEGEAGLADRRLGKASGKRVPADRAEEVERLYRERYQGFTVKHFHEHLIKDHGFGWSYTWTKLHLQWTGVVPKAPRKGAHGKTLAALEGHTGVVMTVAFSPDGARVLTGSDDGKARLWDAATGKTLATFEGHKGAVTAVAFSPDGARVLTGTRRRVCGMQRRARRSRRLRDTRIRCWPSLSRRTARAF